MWRLDFYVQKLSILTAFFTKQFIRFIHSSLYSSIKLISLYQLSIFTNHFIKYLQLSSFAIKLSLPKTLSKMRVQLSETIQPVRLLIKHLTIPESCLIDIITLGHMVCCNKNLKYVHTVNVLWIKFRLARFFSFKYLIDIEKITLTQLA